MKATVNNELVIKTDCEFNGEKPLPLKVIFTELELKAYTKRLS